jgi:N,N-dimethylformamidase
MTLPQDMVDTTAVLGYALPLRAAPGERIAFYLSSATLTEARAQIVRVRCADPDPAGPGLRLIPAASPIDGTVGLSYQPIHCGSCAVVADAPVLRRQGPLSLGCLVYPTLIDGTPQTVLSRWNAAAGAGWRLGLDRDGHVAATVAGDGQTWTVRTPRPLLVREWAFIGAVLNPAAGTLEVFQHSLHTQGGRDRSCSAVMTGLRAVAWPADVPVVIAGHSTGAASPAAPTAGHFNGKIDRPRLHASALAPAALRALVEAVVPPANDADLVAAWDFSQEIGSEGIVDLSANRLDGSLRQMPMRGATGANWDGRTRAWTEAPWQYGAIHFHDDDIVDAGWQKSIELDLPADWRSGYYALRLTTQGPDGRPVESHVPFFVRAPRLSPVSRLAVVASTATYLAYANSATRIDQLHMEMQYESLLILSNDDVYLSGHRELGISTYDMHRDGSGCCYSSARRPILNMRPRGNTFNYVNDTFLLDWLEAEGIDYDLITDEDIHEDGARALSPYAVVITASHPEYYSRAMLEAFDAYQGNGGRHLYLGGNGFYWRIAFHPTAPSTIEIRRGTAGTRTWEGEPGENSLSLTGEPGGLWRDNGRPPQRLVGVGFDGQVFDHSWPYHRQPGGMDPRVAFVFAGVGEAEVIGNFGLRLGGAAGLETDRVDPLLGSPPDLIVLATAPCLSPGSLPTPEEFYITHRGLTGEQNFRVRADMTFFPTAKGGAVFTTGSIAWCCSLPHNGYSNNVARITGNVLRRFLDPAPFEGF